MLKIAIPTEITEFECRVAATPETVKKMIATGLSVSVQSGAGEKSSLSDTAFAEAGAEIAKNENALYQNADIILKVARPQSSEVELFPKNAILIGMLQPRIYTDLVESFNSKGVHAFSLDAIPRIARAQKMDALSSQSNIAGYKAVLMGADRLKKMMPLMMTAAGTITPAKVFILGAGVAGLQAIATAKRLGAVVEAFDTRPVVKEQVESLGGKFLEIEMTASDTEDKGGYAKELDEETHKREMELVTKHAKDSDIVITTALIPGKPAPLLITEDAVKGMRAGSVIIDLAAETGGNCALTEKDREASVHGVTIVGHTNLPSLVPNHASSLYSRNILSFLMEICPKGALTINLEDEVIGAALCTRKASFNEGKVNS